AAERTPAGLVVVAGDESHARVGRHVAPLPAALPERREPVVGVEQQRRRALAPGRAALAERDTRAADRVQLQVELVPELLRTVVANARRDDRREPCIPSRMLPRVLRQP